MHKSHRVNNNTLNNNISSIHADHVFQVSTPEGFRVAKYLTNALLKVSIYIPKKIVQHFAESSKKCKTIKGILAETFDDYNLSAKAS